MINILIEQTFEVLDCTVHVGPVSACTSICLSTINEYEYFFHLQPETVHVRTGNMKLFVV